MLCRADVRGLVVALEHLARDLLDDLEVTRTRQDRIGPAGGVGAGHGDTSGALEWNDHASGVLGVADATLAAWATEVWRGEGDEQRARDPLGPQHRRSLPDLARWLRRNVIGLQSHPEAGLAHEQIVTLTARARRAVDIPRTVARFEVGSCPVTLPADTAQRAGEPCPGTVHARIGRTETAPSAMTCDADRTHTWGTSEWYRAGRRMLVRRETLRRRTEQHDHAS